MEIEIENCFAGGYDDRDYGRWSVDSDGSLRGSGREFISPPQSEVAMRDDLAPEIQLEASGGVRLETIGEIAETGVDRISVGALTHSAQSLDIGLDWG